MKKNMGSADSITRFLLAAIIVVLYFTNIITGTLAIILLIFATIFVLTGFVRVCPLYLPFKFNTCNNKSK